MEVVSLVGGPFLSAAFNFLINKLDSCESLNFEKKVLAELQNWKGLLPKIIALTEDAEKKKVTNRAVKLWLDDLKSLAQDMEFVIGKFEVDTKRCYLSTKPEANISKVRRLLSSCFKSSRIKFDRETASKVKGITTRLQDFARETRTLGPISMSVDDGERPKKVALRRLATSLPECHVYGRESDRDAILQKLLNDEGKDDGDFVIPIVGKGGVGKTTLARLVYNDEKLKGKFELKAWLCVSDDFDLLRITQTILQQVTKEWCDLQDLNLLQERLTQKLYGQKFLLVLDDVCNLNYCHWDLLQTVFRSGASGSKILVTTRDKDVAKIMRGNENAHCLESLPDDACLSLLARHALGTENLDANPDLKGVGKEIIRKCGGLPGRVKIIGGLLRGESCCDEWKQILKSKIWDLPEDEGGILPTDN